MSDEELRALVAERDEARREARDALTTINRLAGMLEAAVRPKVLHHSGKMTRQEIEKIMAGSGGELIRVDSKGNVSVADHFDGTYPVEGPRTAVLSRETRGDGSKEGGS